MFGAGLFLIPLGLFLMYDSGFLLHPSGYVVCNARCYYYEFVYPIKRAEFWIGFLSFVLGLCSSGLIAGIISIRRSRNSPTLTPATNYPKIKSEFITVKIQQNPFVQTMRRGRANRDQTAFLKVSEKPVGLPSQQPYSHLIVLAVQDPLFLRLTLGLGLPRPQEV